MNLCLFLIQGAVQWLVFQSYFKKVDWWSIFPLIMGYLAGFQYLPFALILWLLFQAQINTVWQQELNCRFPLTYWLAVNAAGSVVAYHPVNQVSQDNLELTPLPQLVGDSELVSPTAKLQLMFFPPLILELKPLSGKSIPKIAIETLFVTVANSYFIFSFIIYV
ncbi:MAG: hypothetical protein AAFR62_15465 [Cyanobacteria bacterium J06629_2]